MLDGLTDNFQVAGDSVLNLGISEKGIATSTGIRQETSDRVTNVLEVNPVVLHREERPRLERTLQGLSVLQNPVTQIRAHATFGDHVYLPT